MRHTSGRSKLEEDREALREAGSAAGKKRLAATSRDARCVAKQTEGDRCHAAAASKPRRQRLAAGEMGRTTAAEE